MIIGVLKETVEGEFRVAATPETVKKLISLKHTVYLESDAGIEASITNQMYIDAGANNNALVIPVGIAFENAYKLNPNIKLHKSFDGSHPSLLGTYLASCVVFASITQKSPRGIDYNYFNEISDVDKNFLQDVAHMTVETFFDIKL